MNLGQGLTQAGIVDGQCDFLSTRASSYKSRAAYDVAEVLGTCSIHRKAWISCAAHNGERFAFSTTHTCSILFREAGHCDLSGRDGGGLQGQAGEWVDNNVGRHRGVGGRHKLVAGMGDEASVDAQGLREEAALL